MIFRKLSTTFILLFIIVVGFSQQSILQTKISLPNNEYNTLELLEYIQKNTSISFSYKTKLFEQNSITKLPSKNAKLQDVLQQICTNKDIDFVVINGVVVIKTKKEIQKIIKKTQSTNPEAKIEYIQKPEIKTTRKEIKENSKYVLSGKIMQSISGEVMLNAEITIDSLLVKAYSNEFGFFSVALPKGNHTITINYNNFYTISKQISIPEQTFVNIEMIANEKNLESQKATIVQQEITTKQSIEYHSQDNVNQVNSHFLHTNNPIKDLEKLPGIQQIGDISSLFIVRGGNTDQNLIILDDAPILNATHLFGYYSTFIPHTIKDIKIYKANTPAQFGGKLSSVVDIRTNDGNENKLALFTEINPIASTISIESPIVKKWAAVSLHIRKSNLSWLFKDSDGNSLYSFYDAHAKINFKINNKHRFYYSLYSGGDNFNEISQKNGDFGIAWSNVANSFRWNYIVSPKIFSNTTLYGSSYNYYLYTPNQNFDYWNSKIETGGLKSDITYFKNNNNTIRFGFDISGFTFNPGNLHLTNQDLESWNPIVSSSTIGIVALYYSHEKHFTSKSSITYGARMPISSNRGPSVYYTFDEQANVIDTISYSSGEVFNKTLLFEPRLTYKYLFSPAITAIISYSKTTQSIHQISNSETQITSLDIWLPISNTIQPQIARQISSGFQYVMWSKKIIISSDIYIKSLQNQIYYAPHANMILNPLIEGELRFGKTLAKGIECMIQKNSDNFTGWISYTYSTSIMKQENQYVPTIANRPHDISIGTRYSPSNRIYLQAQWNFLSGKPITTPTGFYEFQGKLVPIYSQMYNSTLPEYHKLDISAQFILNKNHKAKWKHTITIAAINVYARKNPVSINFNKIENNSEFVIPENALQQKQYVTTILYAGTVIPTLSYAISFN